MVQQSSTEQQSFLQKVIDRSELQTEYDAQVAAKIVFRIMRDLMPTKEVETIEQQLKADSSDQKVVDLWNDLNVMVAFFSRVSPLRQLPIGYDLFMLRLQQEAALPDGVSPENVTQAVFSCLKDELPENRINEIQQFLPDKLRDLWQQA